jgi:signal transduction histidine kinase
VRDLRTATQAGVDLPAVISAAIARLRLDPTVEAKVLVEGEPRPLHPVALDEIAGVAGEALFNAFTHAQAEHVTVEVCYDRNHVVVRIRDDGVGIAPEILDRGGREGHFGLAGMRERAEKVRGQLSIRSTPGAGSEVSLSVPASMAYARPGRRWLPFAPRRLELED